MREALNLAADARFIPGPNPRVGAVVLDANGDVVGEGAHLGAGTDHAEVVALAQAGPRAAGGTAIVTLEPCTHHGQTPPCVEALIAAGIRRVVYGQQDPNPQAAGGELQLRAAGIEVDPDVCAPEARALNVEWTVAVSRGTPFVTLKVASTLDGYVAAEDGTSRWITGVAARHDAHAIRSQVGAVLVGTGTALTDDPLLTDRRGDSDHQPMPVVMGYRELPATSRLLERGPLLLRTHDPHVAMAELYQAGVRHVLVEGGPTVTAAFLRSGSADRVVWYLSPKLLGTGRRSVDSLSIETIEEALELRIVSAQGVGEDLRIDLEPQ